MADAPVRRQTRQRTAVADALQSQAEFRSAQEIYDVVRGSGSSIGLTTVYRTLQAMVEDGQVDVIVRDDGESVYRQCSASHHHHLVCRACRRTVEVQAPEVERWAAGVGADHGYAEISHTVEVFGLCPDCSRSR